MKFIPGFNNRYSVDKEGKIYSFNNFHKHQGNGTEIHGRINKFGYVQIRLARFKGDKIKTYLLHRLVAITYLPNPDNKPQVNHKNGKKHDNRLCNLEWATRSENKLHSYRELGEINAKSMLGRSGKDSPTRKPVIQMSLQGEVIREFISGREAAKILGLNSTHISSAANGKLPHHGGFKWKFG